MNFSAYSLSETERVLRFKGQIVPLPPKAIDLLRALLQSPGAVVAKEDLMTALWGDAAVEEGNLNQLAFRLRRAFERCDDSVHIETVPRRGYRLVLPLTRQSGPSPAPAWRSRAARRWLALVGAVVALGAVAGVSTSDTIRGQHARTETELGYLTWSNARTSVDIERSITYFRQALDDKPSSARAHAGLADALVSRALRETGDRSVVMDAQAALENGQQAVQLDPNSADALAAFGQAQAEFGDPHIAERALRRAVTLAPDSTEARTWYGELLLSQGRADEAAAQFRSAHATNSSWTEADDNLALLAYLRRAFAQAQAYARQSLVLGPRDTTARLFLAVSEIATRPRRAELDALRLLRVQHGDDTLAAHALLSYIYATEERTGPAALELHSAQSIAGRVGTVSDPFTVVSLAGTYSLENRTDDAFAWLSRLDRNARVIFANDSRLDRLRADSRFHSWIRN